MTRSRFSAVAGRAAKLLLHSAEPSCHPIVGTAVGPRDPARGLFDPVLFVYLSRPVPRESLPLHTLGHNAVVTRVTGHFTSTSALTAPIPASPGSAIVTHGVPGYGTLGGLLRGSHGQTFGLTCAHVLNAHGAPVFASGPSRLAPLGHVAALVSSAQPHVPADAGLIRLLPGAAESAFPSTLSPIHPTPLDPATVRRAAHHGASSGYRESNVLAYRATIRVFTGQPRIYSNVVVFEKDFAAPGDSGSLVFSLHPPSPPRPIAMIFAKSNDDPGTESLTLGCIFSSTLSSLEALTGSPLTLLA